MPELSYRQWNREVTEAQKRDRHLSLSKTLARTFAWEYIILALFHIFYEFVLRYNDNFVTKCMNFHKV